MSSNSILEIFLVLSKYYSIQELVLSDILCNFKILKEKDEYRDLLKEYVYEDEKCPKLVEEISDLMKTKKIKVINQAEISKVAPDKIADGVIMTSIIDDNILSQIDSKNRALGLKMVGDYISINTEKYSHQKKLVK